MRQPGILTEYTRITEGAAVAQAAATAQWSRWRTCTQRAWLQLPLVSIGVTGGGRKTMRLKLLPCASKVLPWYLVLVVISGTSKNKVVNDLKFGRLAQEQLRYWHQRADERHSNPTHKRTISGQRQSWKTQGELGVSKSMECDIFPSVLGH